MTSFYDFLIVFWICFNSAVILLLFISITRSNQDLDNKYSKNTGYKFTWMKSIHLIGWTLSMWPSLILWYRLGCWYRPVYICAFILCVSDCNKQNGYWYGGQYQDRHTALGSWYEPWNWYFHRLRLGQSVYSDIALHINNYYLNIFLMKSIVILKCYVIYHTPWICFKYYMLNIKHNILSNRE